MRTIKEISGRILDQIERRSFIEPDDGRDVSDAPCCEECGEYPDDDYLYDFDGEWLCGECLLDKHDTLECRSELKYCDSCGAKESSELYYHNGKAICIDCLLRQYDQNYMEG